MLLLKHCFTFAKNNFMSQFIKSIILALLLLPFTQCKKDTVAQQKSISKNEIHYAKGFALINHPGYSVVTVTNPWPKADKTYTYILQEKNGSIPDSLKHYPTIPVPIKSIVLTSTTHIPSLEMLGVAQTLIGFPNLNYISSEKVRALVEAKKVKELGSNQDLNTEVILDLQPNVIIGYGLDNNNPTLDNLQKNGLKVLFNGDWNEQTPLGKAEWIKFFGALYGKQNKANQLFSKIEKDYLKTLEIAKKASHHPSILAGDMYEDKWYLPQGSSWGCQLLKEAQGDYLWAETSGTGSLSLSFETVLEKGKNADLWITSGQFGSLKEMLAANPHYAQFKAFQNKNVFSFNAKKGKTGGVLYYELAPNRPDIVLKDIVKILHPELLPTYHPFFFEKLK